MIPTTEIQRIIITILHAALGRDLAPRRPVHVIRLQRGGVHTRNPDRGQVHGNIEADPEATDDHAQPRLASDREVMRDDPGHTLHVIVPVDGQDPGHVDHTVDMDRGVDRLCRIESVILEIG